MANPAAIREKPSASPRVLRIGPIKTLNPRMIGVQGKTIDAAPRRHSLRLSVLTGP
ncbi:hypothetical protein [Maliponia aquimaris]|uniref:hypothetical protein n=1 Tax=Maliponia aquimaris TaxID=1673631 RepID=UPI0015961CD6|nr:hypothetical protein [Maliponia aquimaris]